jgi:beta-N-acetylhexosaminidase
MSANGRATALLTGLVMGVTSLMAAQLSQPGTAAINGRAVAQEQAKLRAAAKPPEELWAARTLSRMTLDEKIGQLFVVYTFGASADAVDPRNQHDYGVDTPAQVVEKYHLGGVIYFDWTSGLTSPRQVAELSNGLQRAALRGPARVPLLISTDQENGAIVRIGPPVTVLPTAAQLGAAGSTQDAQRAAEVSGRELRAMGVNHDLAPVADVNLNPANPVLGNRTYSADPAVAAAMTEAQVRGYQESVAATAKHFPGHGGTASDSHTGLAVITHDQRQWEELDAPPFRAAVAAGVDTVMLGHIVLPKLDPSGLPATLSPTIASRLLRDELGFRGVVMTDSLQMQGVRAAQPDERIPVLAIQAGADLLLMPQNLDVAYRGVLAAVRSGELSERRVDESVRRILELKWRRGLVEDALVDVAAVDSVVGSPANRDLAARLTHRR